MTRSLSVLFSRILQISAAACLVALSLSALAHETEIKTADPGFRPPSQYAAAFLESLDSATIAVYPTIVRRANRTAHSFASQAQIIESLNTENILTAVAGRRRIDLGRLLGTGSSQWEVFENDMQRIAEALQKKGSDAQYHLVMEFLLPVSDQQIFGVHCYVLDQEGQSAFSFLLNSHHQLFVDANLMAANSSEEARSNMLTRATQVGVTALEQQIEHARKVQAGVTLFESPIDETSSMMAFVESDLAGLHVAEKSMMLMCECANIALEKGYQYFMIEEPRDTGDTRMRFKINFYAVPPPGLPVIDLQHAQTANAAPGKGVMIAADWAKACNIFRSKPLRQQPQQQK